MSLRKLASTLRRPLRSTFKGFSRLQPDLLWRRYSALCARSGLDRPVFILSMDCDTSKDIEVVEGVHTKLGQSDIKPVYAVPGQILEEGADVYGKIAASGATFINHGFARHTSWDPTNRIYESFFFYDALPIHQVRRDVAEGHEAIQRILGQTPTGFRTPHFGSFQKKREIHLLHRTLEELGYRYSSSIMPRYGIRWGPMIKGRVCEIPVTGCREDPLTILDSWSFRFDATSTSTPEDYEEQARGLASLLEEGRPLLINLYVDPSQVYDWPGFFEVMALFAPFAIDSYDQLLDMLPS